MKTETYACQSCGIDVVRPVSRGQRPKWCAPCRTKARVKAIQCAQCGADAMTWRNGRFCSRACASAAQVKPKALKVKTEPIDQRSALRRAVESEDYPTVLAEISALSAVDDNGCWVWQRRIRDGYPEARVGGRSIAAHRLALEAKHGAPLGSQAAHHICANTTCVNPEHLQPVTHRDNVAEMLARHSYLARIRELEDALATIAPGHPILRVISVA